MNPKAREAVNREHCRELKVPRILREYQSLARQAAEGQWAYEDYLLPLLEVETLARRESSSRQRFHATRFLDVKTMEQLDWDI